MSRNGENNKEIFTNIFKTNHWMSSESFSGPGSELAQTRDIRVGLARIIKDFQIKSVLDIPCGDFNWMKKVDLVNVDYTGADIVTELISRNNKLYSNKKKRFYELDITKDKLPKADLVFSRDCFVHLTNKETLLALKNIKSSGAKFLLTTTYVGLEFNSDTSDGKWRPINLCLTPFRLPQFIDYIATDFRNNGKNYPGNGMALWRVKDLINKRANVSHPKVIFVGGVNGSGKSTIVSQFVKCNPSFRAVHGAGLLMEHLGIKNNDYSRLRSLPKDAVNESIERVIGDAIEQAKRDGYNLLLDAHYLRIVNGEVTDSVGQWIKDFDLLLGVTSQPKIALKRLLEEEKKTGRDRALFAKSSGRQEKMKLLSKYGQTSTGVMRKYANMFGIPSTVIKNNDDLDSAVLKLVEAITQLKR